MSYTSPHLLAPLPPLFQTSLHLSEHLLIPPSILPIFVDDCIFASNSLWLLDDLVVELSRSFKLRDLGPTTALLGIVITRDRPNRRLMLSQRQYILDMMERYGQADSTPVNDLDSSKTRSSSRDKEFDAKVQSSTKMLIVGVLVDVA